MPDQWIGTTKITDTSGISIDITIPIPDALVAYGGNNMAGLFPFPPFPPFPAGAAALLAAT